MPVNNTQIASAHCTCELISGFKFAEDTFIEIDTLINEKRCVIC